MGVSGALRPADENCSTSQPQDVTSSKYCCWLSYDHHRLYTTSGHSIHRSAVMASCPPICCPSSSRYSRPWISLLAIFLALCHLSPVALAAYPASVTGFYTDNSAQQTVLLDQTLSPRQKKEIRNEILHLLGLEHNPKVKGAGRMDYNSVPQYMLQLYRSLGAEADGAVSNRWQSTEILHNSTSHAPGTMAITNRQLGNADLIMGFVNQARIQKLFSDGGRRFYFDFSEVKSTERMTSSVLRIYKFTTPWLFDRGPFRITLFKVTNLRTETRLQETSSLTVHALAEGWLDMDATESLKNWVLEPEEQVLMYLEVTDINGVDMEPSVVGLVDSSGPEDKQAFLVAGFKATHKLHTPRRRPRVADTVRVKRSPAPATYYSDEKDYGWKYPPDRPSRRACQRRQLQVSFKALGWQSWVIAPEGYPAFYCEGACTFPLNAHMNATNHAIVQALVHLVKPFLATNPCCAPTTLNGISFLYLDNSYNVVLKQYKNMVVQACGCH